MTLDALIMFLGAVVTALPFLGFPLKWDNVILVVVGILLIMLGIIVRRRGLKRKSAVNTKSAAFVENMPREMAEPVSRGVPRAAEEA